MLSILPYLLIYDVIKLKYFAINSQRQSHTSPSLHSSRYLALLDTASALQAQILQTQQSKAKIDSSTDALQTYVELLLKINGDLLDTLIQREQNRARALRIDAKYKPPPRLVVGFTLRAFGNN